MARTWCPIEAPGAARFGSQAGGRMATSEALRAVTAERFQFDESGHITDHTLLHLDTPRSAPQWHALGVAAKALLVGAALLVGLLLLATTVGCTAS